MTLISCLKVLTLKFLFFPESNTMTRIAFKSNPTDLKFIDKKNITISINRDSMSNIESFSVIKVDLEGLTLPPDAQLSLFAYSKWAEKRSELGSVSRPEFKKNINFEDVEPIGATFRLIVKKKDEHLLLATCEKIRPSTDDIDYEGILHTDTEDIGEKIFELRLDSDTMPTIVFSNRRRLNLMQKVRDRDPMIRAYVLPQVIESVLVYLKIHPAVDDDPSHWQNKWLNYIAEKTSNPDFEFEEDLELLDELFTWARSLSSEISDQIKFVTRFENTFGEQF